MGRLGLLYFTYYFALGSNTAFLASWLTGRGLAPGEIALAGALALVARTLGQPLIGYAGDHYGRRAVLILCSAAAAAAMIALALSSGTAAIYPLIFVASLFLGPVLPLTDALALADKHVNYGRARLWGSIGFASANLIGGYLIDRLGVAQVIWIDVAGLSVLALVTRALPRAATVPGPSTRRAELLAFLKLPLAWLFILSIAAMNAAHAYYYLFSVKHWHEHLGLSYATTGWLWFAGVAAETVLLFALGNRATRKWAIGLMLVGGLGAMVRFSITAFDPPLAILFAAQALHALSYGAMHLGAMQVLRVAVPPRISTAAMGVYAAIVNGVVFGLVTLSLGSVYEAWAGRGFLLSAAFGLVGALGILAFARLWQGGAFARERRPG